MLDFVHTHTHTYNIEHTYIIIKTFINSARIEYLFFCVLIIHTPNPASLYSIIILVISNVYKCDLSVSNYGFVKTPLFQSLDLQQ